MDNFISILNSKFLKNSDDVAVQFKHLPLTYNDLKSNLNRIDQLLGNSLYVRILLMLPDSLASYIYHIYSFWKGSVLIPLSPQVPSSKLYEVIKRVSPNLIVTNGFLFKRHSKILNNKNIVIDKSIFENSDFYFELETVDDFAFVSQSIQNEMPQETRYIVFTSGTTGIPKGVCLSENNILSAAKMNATFLSLDPGRKSIVTVTHYDYYGFIQIYSHLLSESSYTFGDNISFRKQLLKRIIDENITDLVLVPFTLRQLLTSMGDLAIKAFEQLKYITSASDVLTFDLQSSIFDVNPTLKIFNIYGLTEAGRACYRIIDKSSIPSFSIGVPSPGVSISIDNSRYNPGEIVIEGPNVMQGYLESITNNMVKFKFCNQVHTGDLGYYDENNEIILIGRQDHLLNIKGFKIHPFEIENLAMQVKGVADALAYMSKNDKSEDAIFLDVVLSDKSLSLSQLNIYLRKNLENIFVPQKIDTVKEINRTEIGFKTLRNRN